MQADCNLKSFRSKLFRQLLCVYVTGLLVSNTVKLPKVDNWITHLNGENVLNALFTVHNALIKHQHIVWDPCPTGFGMGPPISLIRPWAPEIIDDIISRRRPGLLISSGIKRHRDADFCQMWDEETRRCVKWFDVNVVLQEIFVDGNTAAESRRTVMLIIVSYFCLLLLLIVVVFI